MDSNGRGKRRKKERLKERKKERKTTRSVTTHIQMNFNNQERGGRIRVTLEITKEMISVAGIEQTSLTSMS
jgi:hypothetical protein